MPSDEYHARYDHWSKTMLSHFVDSRLKAYHYYVKQSRKPPGPSRPMLLGSIAHDVVLEGAELVDIVAIYDESCFKSNGHINPSRRDAFEAQHEGKYCLKPDEAEQAYDAINALLEHPVAELLQHDIAVREQPIFWKDDETGVPCRCCPDALIDCAEFVDCYDLKFTERPKPREFEKHSNNLTYYLQDAHYSAGVAHKYGKPVSFTFVLIEPVWPYRVSTRSYSPTSRDIARDYRTKLLESVRSCTESGDWRDPWMKDHQTMEVGPWDLEGVDSSEMEFDDE